MTSNAAVGLSPYRFFSTENLYHDEAAAARRPVWNSRTSALSEVLRLRRTPVVVRDAGRRSRDLYVHSVSSTSVAVADGLTTDRRSGLVSTGRRYFIPVDHSGWFELLSQDGHAAAPVTSVQQLMKLAPQRCLLRRTIVAMSADGGARQACKITAGEILSIEGSTSRDQCLRCRIVSTGQTVLLAADQRGLFSAVAGPTDVAGVHRVRSIVSKFRLPVVVRLITRNRSANDSSSNSSASAIPSVAFRVTATRTELAAYVVPLWLIKSPSNVNRRSLLSLPITAQASSVLDGVAPSSETASENWTEAEWSELERRCEQLIKLGDVTVELTKLFPTYSADDRQRTVPVTSSAEPSAGDNDWRLLREIDHIYEAIKARDAPSHKATTRQAPRRYRSVRQDAAAAVAFNGADVKMRSPARRSQTLDSKPAHHHSSLDVFHYQSQPQLDSHPRRMSSPPVRLSRMMSQPSSAQLQLQLHTQQLQHTEPVYEELTTSAAQVKNGTDEMVESGQYVLLAERSTADNSRQLIKHNSTASSSSSKQSHHPTSFERSRRWSLAVGPAQSVIASQLQVFDDLPATNNDSVTVPEVPAVIRPPQTTTITTSNDNITVPAIRPPQTSTTTNSDDTVPVVPVMRRADTTTTTSKSSVHLDTVPRSVSSGRLTSSSSDDVTATERNLSSGRGTVSNTLKRALCRHVTGAKTAAENQRQIAVNRTPRHVPVTSPSSDVIAVECAGGRVTHF